MPTFYGLPAYASGSTQLLNMQEATPAQALFSPNTYWQVADRGGEIATLDESADMNSQVMQLATAFTIADKPASLDTATGNAFRTPVKLSGRVPSTAWEIGIGAGPGINPYGGMRLRLRIYKSVNADGTSPTLLTPTTLLTPELQMQTASTAYGFTATWAAPEVELYNEYLFLALAAESRAAATNNDNKYFNLYQGPKTFLQVPTPGPFSMEMVGAMGI